MPYYNSHYPNRNSLIESHIIIKSTHTNQTHKLKDYVKNSNNHSSEYANLDHNLFVKTIPKIITTINTISNHNLDTKKSHKILKKLYSKIMPNKPIFMIIYIINNSGNGGILSKNKLISITKKPSKIKSMPKYYNSLDNILRKIAIIGYLWLSDQFYSRGFDIQLDEFSMICTIFINK